MKYGDQVKLGGNPISIQEDDSDSRSVLNQKSKAKEDANLPIIEEVAEGRKPKNKSLDLSSINTI